MYDQIREDIFFFMFYASVAMLALMACCYLLFRRANAIAPDVTPPVRLRRWTAAFFATVALCHLWYLPVMVVPLIAGLAWCIVSRSDTLLPMIFVYFLLMWLGLIIYMVRATRQYGRWLRDNYADLEHKEVWQSFVVLAIILGRICDECQRIRGVLQRVCTLVPPVRYALCVRNLEEVWKP